MLDINETYPDHFEEEHKEEKFHSMRDWCLEEEPETEYEIRVCVLETKNIPIEDLEGTSDVYV
jgi:hypothetical protein